MQHATRATFYFDTIYFHNRRFSLCETSSFTLQNKKNLFSSSKLSLIYLIGRFQNSLLNWSGNATNEIKLIKLIKIVENFQSF